MKRDIVILDCEEIKCPLVLLYVFKEVTGYFKRNNYVVKIVNNINELTNNSIVFMGDTFRCNDPVKLLNSIAPEAIYIGWYWHNINTEDIKYFIYTYENMLNIHYSPQRAPDLIKIRSFKNNAPLLLRANEDPKLIGTYDKNIKYDYCYMGWVYRPDLVPRKFKGIYHATTDHTKFLDYDSRKEIYLSSIFALGHQCGSNIASEHVSQRIYEGMAYGCIVLTNSLPACIQTNNIPIYVDNIDDMERIMEYYLNNPELIKKKQEEGYEFIRKFGTNSTSIQKFTDLIKEKFNIDI